MNEPRYYCMDCPGTFPDGLTANKHHDATGHRQHWKAERAFDTQKAGGPWSLANAPASPAPEPPSAQDEDEAEVRWTFDELRRIADRGDSIDAWSVREVSRLVDDLLAERDALAADAAFAEWLRRSCSIVWQTPYVGGSDIKHTPHTDAWASLRAQFENGRSPPQAAMQRAERGTEAT